MSQESENAGAPEDVKDFAAPPPAPATASNEPTANVDIARSTDEPVTSPSERPKELRLPTLKPLSNAPIANMSASSTVSGKLNDARRPGVPLPARGGGALPADLAAKMAAFRQSRAGPTPRPQPGTLHTSSSTGAMPDPNSRPSPMNLRLPGGGVPGNFQMPPNMRPQLNAVASAPAVQRVVPAKKSIAARRGPGLSLGAMGGMPGQAPATPVAGGAPTLDTNQTNNPAANGGEKSAFEKFSEFVDTKKGTLNFANKAVIHGDGIDFSNGKTFNISLDEVDTLDELGKGNYGTVYKVRHSRPRIRKVGQGLAGNKANASPITPISNEASPISAAGKGTTGIVMAMKEIRLELDEAKFAAIIMELDILHRCVSPYIIDFYGAFFQEGAVYICIEFMDGGSIDKIYGDGVPENVLRKITYATTRGLRELKDVHNIIHRDVKPTNILVNTRGQVKICDFGVSGNLVASIAKTNIGCQSYMAPERISGGGMSSAGAAGGTYSVQSDIWSLGLSIIECAMGRYPYPPETYNNIFSQLNAIVEGEPPALPTEGYSQLAHDFVKGCLNKVPKLRPTYSALLAHPWLAPISKPATITEEDEELAEAVTSLDISSLATTVESGHMGDGIGGENRYDAEVARWCEEAIERKRTGKMGFSEKPALHAAPLDSATSPMKTT